MADESFSYIVAPRLHDRLAVALDGVPDELENKKVEVRGWSSRKDAIKEMTRRERGSDRAVVTNLPPRCRPSRPSSSGSPRG